jgi:hypothetical protein
MACQPPAFYNMPSLGVFGDVLCERGTLIIAASLSSFRVTKITRTRQPGPCWIVAVLSIMIAVDAEADEKGPSTETTATAHQRRLLTWISLNPKIPHFFFPHLNLTWSPKQEIPEPLLTSVTTCGSLLSPSRSPSLKLYRLRAVGPHLAALDSLTAYTHGQKIPLLLRRSLGPEAGCTDTIPPCVTFPQLPQIEL